MATDKPSDEQKKPQTATTILSFHEGNCDEALSTYEAVFGAKKTFALQEPSGKIVHACMKLGTTEIYCEDDHGTIWPHRFKATPHPAKLYLYVDDCDKVVAKAVDAGFTLVKECKDEFWGERVGCVLDKYGHEWTVSTTRELSEAEAGSMEERHAKWCKEMDEPVGKRPREEV